MPKPVLMRVESPKPQKAKTVVMRVEQPEQKAKTVAMRIEGGTSEG
jgi:hypothetical protein